MQPEVERRPTVGVMGSGVDEHASLAAPLGALVAELGANLLTGGGGGVMACTARAFCAAPRPRGVSLGVLPAERSGYPNAWVEVPVRTHLPYSGERGTDPLSRNHINVLSSDAIVALPGGAGTASEVQLARRYARPLLAYLGAAGAIRDLPTDVPVARELEEVRAFLRAALAGR